MPRKERCIAFKINGERCDLEAKYSTHTGIKSYCMHHWKVLTDPSYSTNGKSIKISSKGNIGNREEEYELLVSEGRCPAQYITDNVNTSPCSFHYECEEKGKHGCKKGKYYGIIEGLSLRPMTPIGAPGSPRFSGALGRAEQARALSPRPFGAPSPTMYNAYTPALPPGSPRPGSPRVGSHWMTSGVAVSPKTQQASGGFGAPIAKGDDRDNLEKDIDYEEDSEEEYDSEDSEEEYDSEDSEEERYIKPLKKKGVSIATDDGKFKEYNGKSRKIKNYGTIKDEVKKREIKAIRGRYEFIRNDTPPRIKIDSSFYELLRMIDTTFNALEALEAIHSIKMLITSINPEFRLNPEKWSVEESVIDYIAEKFSSYVTDRERLELIMMYLFDYDRRNLDKKLSDYGFTQPVDENNKNLLDTSILTFYKLHHTRGKDMSLSLLAPREYHPTLWEQMKAAYITNTDKADFKFNNKHYGKKEESGPKDKTSPGDSGTGSESKDNKDFDKLTKEISLSEMLENINKLGTFNEYKTKSTDGSLDSAGSSNILKKFYEHYFGIDNNSFQNYTGSNPIKPDSDKNTNAGKLREKIKELFDAIRVPAKTKRSKTEFINNLNKISKILGGKLNKGGIDEFKKLKFFNPGESGSQTPQRGAASIAPGTPSSTRQQPAAVGTPGAPVKKIPYGLKFKDVQNDDNLEILRLKLKKLLKNNGPFKKAFDKADKNNTLDINLDGIAGDTTGDKFTFTDENASIDKLIEFAKTVSFT